MGRKKNMVISEKEIAKAKQTTGEPIPQSVRHTLETELKADFSGVRVHTGKNAKKLTTAVGAQAFTHGTHIFFGSGQYQPHSAKGKELLVHELTHVVQQRKGSNNTDTSDEAKASAASE